MHLHNSQKTAAKTDYVNTDYAFSVFRYCIEMSLSKPY